MIRMKKSCERTGNQAQRKQPAGDELPRRQGEQKEVQRLAKNWVHNATTGAWRVPKERERRPLRRHGAAGCSGNDKRNAECDEPQNRLNRQLHRLSADENRVTGRQIREMRSLESQKRSVQDDKCGRRKSREDSPLKAERFPEYVPIAERPEPEHVHVIRHRGPTAEDNGGKDGNNNEEEAAAMAAWRRLQTRPVDRLRHCSTPFSSASLVIRMILPALPQVLKTRERVGAAQTTTLVRKRLIGNNQPQLREFLAVDSTRKQSLPDPVLVHTAKG